MFAKRKKVKMKIEGMSCSHCVGRVEKALAELGVKANVNLEEGIAQVVCPESITDEKLISAVQEAGYSAAIV